MATPVSICNLALGHVGVKKAISSLSDTTNIHAVLCNRLYEALRDEVLAAAYWNFAMERVELAQVDEEPAFGYSYCYQLPSDCLRVRRTHIHGAQWVREGDKIYTHNETCKIQYVKKITDTSQFSPEFVTALGYRIAVDLAFPIVQSNTLRESLLGIYKEKVGEAKSSDGQEGKLPPIVQHTLLQARAIRGYNSDSYGRGERDV
jgi:hypothetical protein